MNLASDFSLDSAYFYFVFWSFYFFTESWNAMLIQTQLVWNLFLAWSPLYIEDHLEIAKASEFSIKHTLHDKGTLTLYFPTVSKVRTSQHYHIILFKLGVYFQSNFYNIFYEFLILMITYKII